MEIKVLQTKEWKNKLIQKGHTKLYVNIPIETKQKLAMYKAKSNQTIESIVRDSIEFYLHCKKISEEKKK